MLSLRSATTVALPLVFILALVTHLGATADTAAAAIDDLPVVDSTASPTVEAVQEVGPTSVPPDATAPALEGAFGVRFQEETTWLPVLALFAQPGEKVTVEALPGSSAGPFDLVATGGTLSSEGAARWRWTAPETPGFYPLVLSDASGRTLRLQAFVMVPYRGEEELNGFALGRYQAQPLRGNPIYERPRGMIEVRPELLDEPVSPHFRLGQFLCKQPGPFPKYLLLRTRLLTKLELLLDEVKAEGIDASTFTIMSGFRTPRYNAAIGNPTTYSRHAYGDAADIFIDEDGDGRMDDLDGDRRITLADARRLGEIVARFEATPHSEPFIGGLGLYGPKPHRGPFVHVDTRGFPARW